MRKSDSTYIIESPNDALYDLFYDASADSADYRAVIVPNHLGFGGFGFILRRNGVEIEDFAVSEFEFKTEAEARDYLEPQVPYVEIGTKRRGMRFPLNE